MALCLSPTSFFVHIHNRLTSPDRRTTTSTVPRRLFTDQNFSPAIHLHRSSSLFASNPNPLTNRCWAVSPGRPPPPESEPPTGKDPTPSTGPTSTFARLQDTVQIFSAVLFWMSLFFWASAWDGRNNDRPNKGSRFRR